MLIKLEDDYMVNTETVIDFKLHHTSSWSSAELSCKEDQGISWIFWYNNLGKEEAIRLAQEKFKKISDLLEKAVNLKTDKNGAFLCSHCGAPNT